VMLRSSELLGWASVAAPASRGARSDAYSSYASDE